jgi:hypothetical protein
MPTQSDKLQELREGAADNELPYCSKSRVKKWLNCQEKFNMSYLKGYKEPENRYMRRGTDVHETYEDYYRNAELFVLEHDRTPNLSELVELLPDTRRWEIHTEPYITNFLLYEARRADNAPTPDDWLPVEVEAEGWLEDPLGYGDEAIPLMGYADAIYPANSFPEVNTDEGVLIVDFKTGKTPNKKYRDEGIYLEGEYYAMLFESDYEVAGVAGYYPRGNDLITAPLKPERRAKIENVIEEMQAVNGTDVDHLPITEQPLCYYGPGEGEHCPYYNMCSSRWGEPLKHADKTRDMLAAGMSEYQVAAELDCSTSHVYYAKKKLGIS